MKEARNHLVHHMRPSYHTTGRMEELESKMSDPGSEMGQTLSVDPLTPQKPTLPFVAVAK